MKNKGFANATADANEKLKILTEKFIEANELT
jgi:hypothetical protein